MSNSFFRFKEFIVRQDKCAMKVGTDGVLLGAWAASKNDFNANSQLHFLDIGTGTGLIALMLAQRFRNALIDALDIDNETCNQAIENVSHSPFRDRINVFCLPFNDYITDKKYDLIVANPPFFRQSLKSPDERRNLARHDNSLTPDSLICHASSLLADNGLLALTLPYSSLYEIDAIMADNEMIIKRRTDIVTVEGNAPKRKLIEVCKKNLKNKICTSFDCLTIETRDFKQTKEYNTLTKAYYLDSTA